jgi:COMPASS component SWD3
MEAVPGETPVSSLRKLEALLESDDPIIREEILLLIIQFLEEEDGIKYQNSILTLKDEWNVKTNGQMKRTETLKFMRKAILEGDWVEAEKLLGAETFKNQKKFSYEVLKQQYLELVEKQEFQKVVCYNITKVM